MVHVFVVRDERVSERETEMSVPRSAVHWWEESQLRVLVLSSLAIQVFLIVSFCRTRALPGWFRFIMWLAYLGGDAVAIYALATLFNHHKAAAGEDGGSNAMLLQVVWAPVLLLHLGGQDGISAYNIEDNELWSRHLLTAVSQVTVAIYVFCKTWPPGGSDKRLLQAAIVLFVPGVLKCFHKPWALKRASIYSLVSSPAAAAAAAVKQKEGGLYASTLEEYVKEAKGIILTREQTEEGEVQGERASASSITMEDEGRRPRCNDEEPAGTGTCRSSVRRATAVLIRAALEWWNEVRPNGPKTIAEGQRKREMFQGHNEPSKLFVDLSSPYSRRLSILEDFYGLTEERAYGTVQQGLRTAFILLYTKIKTVHLDAAASMWSVVKFDLFGMIWTSRTGLPWAAIGLFHHSHREAYNDIDVKITYVMLCCTAVLEFYSIALSNAVLTPTEEGREQWPEMLAQYSFIQYFARNKNHRKKMWVVSLLGCKDFLDQHWCMKSCFSSATISKLVLQYLKDGWKEKIQDTASYCRFNNHRSSEGLSLSIKREKPLLFDDSVLLWHIATDFCFFSSSLSSEHRCAFAEVPPFIRPGKTDKLIISWIRVQLGWSSPMHTDSCQCSEELTSCKAILCRQMSNYMAYLLFVNPEMLLPGSRRNIFTAAHQELEAIFKDDNQPVALYNNTELTKTIISKLESSSQATTSGTVIHEAWMLAQKLKSLGDEKMWKVIQGVWVEMLCYSASRCRGYLHAKALGKGGEFLSYVWLTLFHMGMETFTDKLHREEEAAGNNAVTTTAPSTCERVTSTTTTGVGAPLTSSEVHTASATAGASSSTFEIHIA